MAEVLAGVLGSSVRTRRVFSSRVHRVPHPLAVLLTTLTSLEALFLQNQNTQLVFRGLVWRGPNVHGRILSTY